MSTLLPLAKSRYDFKGLDLRLVWYPGRTLPTDECSAMVAAVRELNHGPNPFEYGFFSPTITPHQTRNFMAHSIWCLVYAEGRLCGFAYNYDVGSLEGKKIIHLGLVKFYQRFGREVMKAVYNALTVGNIINFGPYYASNISHVPLIIDVACHFMREVYPHPLRQDAALRAKYLPVFDLLSSAYIQPLLNYPPHLVNRKQFIIHNALDMHPTGFESTWRDIPKSDETTCNLFVKEWLNIKRESDGLEHIKDDIIQIGIADYHVLAEQRNAEILNELHPKEAADGLFNLSPHAPEKISA